MSIERISPQPSMPEPFVDLKELQLLSEEGIEVDIIGFFQAAITDEIVDSHLQRLFPAEDANIRKRRSSSWLKNTLAGSHMLKTFNQEVPKSEDLETLHWRLKTFMQIDPKNKDLKYFYSSKQDRHERSTLGKTGRLIFSLVQLYDYSDMHPDQNEQAAKIWANIYNEMHRESPAAPYLFRGLVAESERRINRRAIAETANSKIKSTKLKANKAAYLYSSERYIYFDSPQDQDKKISSNLKVMLTDLEIVNLNDIPSVNFETTIALLLDQNNAEVQKPEKLIRQSVGAVFNFVRGMASSDVTSQGPIGVINKKLESVNFDQGALSFVDIVDIANSVTPIVSKLEDVSLPKLTPSSLADYAKAVDRLTAFCLAIGRVSDMELEDIIRFSLAAECIKLMAFKGVQHKLNQSVITWGDIVLRYPNLSPLEQRELGESLQQSRSEASVQETYRQLRLRHKNRASYRKWLPGGILS